MKKVFFVILLLFTISFVSAKAACTIVSGDGTKIGDEIACGSEHFYVLNNDGTNIKMMAKYNLYVGDIVNKKYYEVNDLEDFKAILVDEYDYSFTNYVTNPGYIEHLIDFTDSFVHENEIGRDKYLYSWGLDTNEDKYYVIYGERINIEHVLQNEKAIGFSGEYKNNTHYPFYGIIDRYYFSMLTYLYIQNNKCFYAPHENHAMVLEKFPIDSIYTKEQLLEKVNTIRAADEEWCNSQEFYDGYVKNSYIYNYLMKYLDELVKIGISDPKIEMISLEDVNEVLDVISDKKMNLEEYLSSVIDASHQSDYVTLYDDVGTIHLDNLSNYLSGDKYNWLYGTTYYTKNMAMDHFLKWDINIFLISSRGDVCVSGICAHANPFIGGLRPIVTIGTDELFADSLDSNKNIEIEEKNPVTSDVAIIVFVLCIVSVVYLSVIKYKVLNNQ